MRALRSFFSGFSFVASLVALAHHLGYDLWGCASCSFVNEMPMSSGLAWGGPLVLGILTYGLWKDYKWARYLLGASALASAGLVWWMLSRNTVCLVCMLVHTGVFASAITLEATVGFSAPLLFSAALIFTATGGWERLTIEQGVGLFQPRPGEEIPQGKVYVLFGDPECGRCQMADQDIAKLPNKPNVLYRWTLLPQKTYRSIRAVNLLEMARTKSRSAYERLLAELRQLPAPLTDDVLLEAAKRSGVGAEAPGWLKTPDEAILNVIGDDQSYLQQLKIQSLPALAELSPPDATGIRTLRRVPFSAIGIQQ